MIETVKTITVAVTTVELAEVLYRRAKQFDLVQGDWDRLSDGVKDDWTLAMDAALEVMAERVREAGRSWTAKLP